MSPRDYRSLVYQLEHCPLLLYPHKILTCFLLGVSSLLLYNAIEEVSKGSSVRRRIEIWKSENDRLWSLSQECPDHDCSVEARRTTIVSDLCFAIEENKRFVSSVYPWSTEFPIAAVAPSDPVEDAVLFLIADSK